MVRLSGCLLILVFGFGSEIGYLYQLFKVEQ